MARFHQAQVDYVPRNFSAFPGLWALPKEPEGDGVLYYLHGGGYIGGDLTYAKGFATTLAAKTGKKTFCIGYRLAPENPFPAALDDAVEGYRYLLAMGYPPEKIVLAGESAGGGLIYCLCLKARELGLPMPAGLIAISPWTDLTQSGASYETNREADPSMTRDRLTYYAQCYTDRPEEPLVSPLFGDLSQMPPSVIFVGGDEVMLDDAVRLHEKLLAAGRRSRLTVRPELWHAYLLYGVKEAEEDYKTLEEFCREVLA